MNAMTVLEVDSSALSSTVAFTGRLACMTRAEAFEVVRSHGGTPSQAVTRQTNVLVVGELGWPLLDDGRPSNKLSRAGSYGIPVVSERRFLEWIGKVVPDSLHRTYSADQIAALSKLSSSTVEELVRFGLLDPRGGLFGFCDLASARQISKLFAHGIALSEIIRSVKEIRHWLPEADLSNLRLRPTHHTIEIEQPEGRTDKRGQFVLPSARLSRTPMLYLSRHRRPRTRKTLQKPSASIAS
jgi:BRCA1 C Terminus (BRCT) domain